MGNQWGFGIHLIFEAVFLVAAITNACLGDQNVTVTCFEHERLALLDFKNSVQDDFKMLSSWVGNDCCRWEGVRCNIFTGHVESLHPRGGFTNYFLSDGTEESLVGNEVKSSLSELKHLKYLDLSGNVFQGSRIPEFIGSFKHLTYLNLSYSGFSGYIPHHIGNLSNLKVLDLSCGESFFSDHQNLMGDDMAWISSLSSLKYLYLNYVTLSKAENLETVFSSNPSLEVLSLNGCAIFGDIPLLNSSATLSKIKHLDLGRNRFKDRQLPGVFRNMTSLEFLDLSSYDLSLSWNFSNVLNSIPSLQEVHLSNCNLQNMHLSPTYLNISTLSNIQLMDLSWNSFEGNFPSILTNLSSLRFLDLSNCKLNSIVPIMPNLLELDLSWNSLKDLGIWRQCHLIRFKVSYNHFNVKMIDSEKNVSECSQYALESLHLDKSFNGGTIPESLRRLTSLRELVLSSNGLTGPLPKFLVSLRLLEVLDLSSNQLNGSIPESLGRLRLLKILDLSNNQLNGSIPESLGRLVTLKHLVLTNNHLTGPIPASLGRLLSLQTFSLSSNLLNDTIPVSVWQLNKLNKLDISNNYLEGVVSGAHLDNLSVLKRLSLANSKLTVNISHEWMPPFQLTRVNLSSCKIANEFPQWLRFQKKLESLVLSKNSISGPLPTWLREMPIIPIFDLSHNKLNGPLSNLPNRITYDVLRQRGISLLYLQNNLFNESIPLSLCERINLWFLNLSRNRLTGKIPSCLGNLQSLITMIFSSNRLSGVIPSSIGQCSSLSWLNLNDNNFVGDLPRELGNLYSLVVLDLGDNKLSGNIPKWIGEELTHLVVFRLHKNNFNERIPRSLCKSSNLQILDVAHNNLTGPVPHCLGGLNGMVTGGNMLSASYDYDERVKQVMKGVELEYTTTLQYVINMDLSSNKLTGGIPTDITTLVSLVGLNLSSNLLTGCIPDNIGNMDALISLDFSRNQLSGMIPPSMAALHFLSHLNLSHNTLSGRIPTGNQLQTLNDPSIYVGNKDLCGAPLPRNCSPHETLTKIHNKAADEPKKVWFYLDVASGFATGFWGIIGVLVFKKEWRQKLFMFSEVTMDKIYVAVMVRVSKMKRRNDAY